MERTGIEKYCDTNFWNQNSIVSVLKEKSLQLFATNFIIYNIKANTL